MAEGDTTTQAVADAQSAPAGSVTSGATTQTEDEPFDKERAMATISKLREKEKEANKATKDLAALQVRMKEIEDAQKTEEQKRADKLAALEKEREAWASEKAALLIQKAVVAYVADTDCLDKAWLIDKLQQAALDLGDDGIPTKESLDKALKAIRADHTALFKPEGAQAPQVSTGATINAVRQPQGNLDPNAVYSLSDPALWNGSQVTPRKQ
jgi:hypothetical protein